MVDDGWSRGSVETRRKEEEKKADTVPRAGCDFFGSFRRSRMETERTRPSHPTRLWVYFPTLQFHAVQQSVSCQLQRRDERGLNRHSARMIG